MATPKKVLLLHYSQTGQLDSLAAHFVQPLQAAEGIEVETVRLEPQTPYPFPWPFWRFFDTFPETVHLQPQPIRTPVFRHERYDLVILAYTVWFLSPAQPITAFLQSPQAAVLRDTPVLTLIGCRNMWLMAQETVKELLRQNGARLVDNVVKIDACSSAASFITTPLWMLSGRKKGASWLPEAGIALSELVDGARFGARVRDCLLTQDTIDAPMLTGMGAVKVNERLIFSEKAAKRSFWLWGRLLMACGRISPVLRRGVLALYIAFLITLILTVVPVSAVVKKLLSPWLKERIAAQKAYFSQPSGE
ncbi:hypothetical protein L1281_001811 [Neisseria sp. HSC-16F19]|nr:dialkylrecorsinol condensing enzyme [Neisseria sp. HSC-16F19]MCP2041217.1 hypothetical protein [Neisseria sp. HSC-16F19]